MLNLAAILRDAALWVAIGLCFLAIAFAASLWFWLSAPSYAAGDCHGQLGRASWYGPESGSMTASGRRFEPDGLSAAHRSLPFGTILIVTDMDTGRSVRVVVLDRGPAKWTGRMLDLSRGAARHLGIIGRGTALVCISNTSR